VIKTRRLGRTGHEVSELALGCFMLTGDFGVSRKEANAIFDTAIEAGINYMDTAEMYGYGESEELVGRALQRHAGKPLIVSSKVGWLDRTIIRYLEKGAYQNENALRRVIEHSLWLLRKEKLEIMMIHEPNSEDWGIDYKTGEAPIMRVLETLKADGVIGAIGVGAWPCACVADMIETGRVDVALVAGGYTIIKQEVRERVIPAAKKHDVGLVMGGTFLQGRLAENRRAHYEEVVRSGNYSWFETPDMIRRILAAYDLSEETGISLCELAIRYILADPDIHTIIPGAQTAAQVEDNVRACNAGPLPADVYARIEEISAAEGATAV
jgi:aryl-alcohol dehydrogenase-like predicted oxidoreductase